MNKRTAIIAALWVIAAVPSTSAVSQQLHESLEKPTGDVWPHGGEEIRTQLRPAAPFNAAANCGTKSSRDFGHELANSTRKRIGADL